MQRRQAHLQQAKALEEDPTIFQYDELYDDFEKKKKEEQTASRKVQSQGPKYIKKLLETAEKRKREYERRIERQVQKERDEEGEQFKDKESFVTGSYKKKLEEIRLAEEEEKKADYLESIGDVQKQSNLDGFYRHLFAQKTKTNPDKAPIETGKTTVEVPTKKVDRQYRKRSSGDAPNEEDGEVAEEGGDSSVAKEHIASNLDADSDFSIDSTDDEEEQASAPASTDKPEDILKDEKVTVEPRPEEEKVRSPSPEETATPTVKIDIWAKRTIGSAFDEAVARYFERKAARSEFEGK